MARFFGTDGIRGLAHTPPVTVETAMALGKAVAAFFPGKDGPGRAIIGQDTRESGEALARAVAEGVGAAGGHALMAGVIPTPGVACLVRELGAAAGIVVSASHNPAEYNGFKVFTGGGFKLTPGDESTIEGMMLPGDAGHVSQEAFGRHEVLENSLDIYLGFLQKCMPEGFSLEGMKIVLDCANGAAWETAPVLFRRVGAEVEALNVSPDGENINRECGSEHTVELGRRVTESGADAGLAFDGDGDRLAVVDELGRAMNGDQVLAICARALMDDGRLGNSLVVGTVMSNMGLGRAVRNMGGRLLTAGVGDRQVMEKMRAEGAVLGGESSGHLIFADKHTTGDGTLSGLELLAAARSLSRPLSDLAGIMTLLPQVVMNVKVGEKPDIRSVPEIRSAIEDAEKSLGSGGRVLVRYSGTEPLCRVMVEGDDMAEIELWASKIAEAVKKRLGAGENTGLNPV